jgi:tetratricopeptide (TPR) repeat protein
MRRLAQFARILFCLGAVALASAQEKPPPASDAEADALYQAKNWVEAARAYESIAAVDASNGRAWYRLGVARLSGGKYSEAAEALAHAVTTVAPQIRPFAMYNLAAAHARMGHTDQAFAWLNKAVEAGFAQPQQMESDEDLASLHSDSRFAGIQKLLQERAQPCRFRPEYRQFDFWVGNWNVTVSAGQPGAGQVVGTSQVERILGDCVIFENYHTPAAFEGKSFSFYDAELKKWRQTWVANNGSVSEFLGEFRDGAMRYEGESHAPGGGRALRRMVLSLTTADRVRQYSESSTDGGKTWSLAYDFTYLRQ